MKRIIPILFALLFSISIAHAGYKPKARWIAADIALFGVNISTSADTVQKVMDELNVVVVSSATYSSNSDKLDGYHYDAFVSTTGDTMTGDLAITGALTATGTGTFGDLIVDTNVLVVDAANDKVGIGTNAPDSIFHIKANVPGTVGSHPAGQLIIQDPDDTVFGNAVITGYESDGAGNPDQQLWYLGNSSSSNTDIIFLNRRNANLYLGTNGVSRLTILGNGYVGIGTNTPGSKLEVNGTITSGDIDASDYKITVSTLTLGEYTFPYSDGTNGQGLITNGSGVLSWGSVGGGGGASSLSVEEDDVQISSPTAAIDFRDGLDVSESPSGEANVIVDPDEVITAGTRISWSGHTLNVDLATGVVTQAYDLDLDDLADGTLSKSKVEDSGNWDSAYGWGDHSGQGYLTSLATGTITQAYDDDLTDLADGTLSASKIEDKFLRNDADDTTAYQLTVSSLVVTNKTTLDSSLSGIAKLTSGVVSAVTVDISDDTDLVAGDYISLADDTLNVNLSTGTVTQAYDADLDDLADGTLSKSKVEDSANWDAAYEYSQSTGPIFQVVFDGGGSAITTGTKYGSRIPRNSIITAWYIYADQSGSIVVDVWKDTWANYPPTNDDSIAGTEKPTLSSAITASDTSLTSMTTDWNTGDVVFVEVESASTVTWIKIDFYGYRD